MLGFSSILTTIIQGLRITELRLSTLFRKLLCIRVFFGTSITPTRTYNELIPLGNSTNSISPLATFVVFVVVAKTTGRTLDVSSAYTALSLITLLSTPMNVIVQTIPMLNAASACFYRIQSFLNSEARKDHRLPLSRTIHEVEAPLTDSFHDGIEMKPLSTTIQENESRSTLISTQNASFAWSLTARPAVIEYVQNTCYFFFILEAEESHENLGA